MAICEIEAGRAADLTGNIIHSVQCSRGCPYYGLKVYTFLHQDIEHAFSVEPAKGPTLEDNAAFGKLIGSLTVREKFDSSEYVFCLCLQILDFPGLRRVPCVVTGKLFGSDLTKDPAGISDSYYIIRNILIHKAACSDDNIAPDRHAGHDLNACTEPDIITDFDRPGVFESGIASREINRMACSVETAVRCDKYIISECYPCSVQYRNIKVGEEIVADFNVISIVAVERRADGYILAGFAEYLSDTCVPSRITRCHGIVLKTGVLCPDEFFQQSLIVICIIYEACISFFFFCHETISLN